MLIGCHVSIAGGIDQAIDRAVERDANCLQSFATSPRSLKFQTYTQENIALYMKKKRHFKIGPHFFHAPYLINLAHENLSYVDACVEALAKHQDFAAKIKAEGTIFHIGSHKGIGFTAVKVQVTDAIVRILKKTKPPVKLFLENAAGHRGVIGDNFIELGEIISNIPKNLLDRVAICLDTQHAFASGYELRTKEGLADLLKKFDETIGLKFLKVIHANDSMVDLGGRKDRHENIGDGFIGKNGFMNILRNQDLKSLPFLLEIPGKDRKGPAKSDVQLLSSLA
jgi:deoxyribonuclease-4